MPFDTVVVGAGLAGTVAALAAAEFGQRVLLVEQSDFAPGGGNTPMSGGVLHTVLAPMTDPPDVLVERIMVATGGTSRRDLVESYASGCGPALDWLEARDFQLEPFPTAAGDLAIIAPRRGFADAHDWQASGSRHELAALQTRLEARGGAIARASSVDGLVGSSESGVGGVVVRSAGACEAVAARRVVLADGGFQANPVLVREHLGRRADEALLRGAGAANGDALRMGLALGAGAVGLENVYGHLMHRDALVDDRFWPAPILDPLLRPGILVDRRGTRFFAESRGGIAATNELMRSDDPRGAWIVVGETGWKSVGVESTLGLPTPAPNPTLTERGATMIRADDLGALARAIGMDPHALAASVDSAPDRADHPPALEPPYLAIPVVPGITFTMGGLAIDGRARVLRDDGSPIPGLFAAGSCTGGLHGGPDAGYVGGLSAALVLGLLAARAA